MTKLKKIQFLTIYDRVSVRTASKRIRRDAARRADSDDILIRQIRRPEAEMHQLVFFKFLTLGVQKSSYEPGEERRFGEKSEIAKTRVRSTRYRSPSFAFVGLKLCERIAYS
jgi:hypothetical protein